MMRRILSFAAILAFAAAGEAAWGAGIFDPLFRVVNVSGEALILRPCDETPIPAKVGIAYPYGSKITVPAPNPKNPGITNEVTLAFSREHKVRLLPNSQILVSHSGEDSGEEGAEPEILDVEVVYGRVQVSGPPPIAKGIFETEEEAIAAEKRARESFRVVTPLVTCDGLSARTRIAVKESPDELKFVTVSMESDSLRLTGPQFETVKIRRNSTVNFLGDADFTRFGCSTGNMTFRVDSGADSKETVTFRPGAVCKIWRLYADVGDKMAVSVMLAYPDGKTKSFVFLNGRSAAIDSIYGDASGEQSADAAENAEGFESMDNGIGEETTGDTVESDSGESDLDSMDFDFGEDSGFGEW